LVITPQGRSRGAKSKGDRHLPTKEREQNFEGGETQETGGRERTPRKEQERGGHIWR
jgi:hypothetical protein